MPESKFSEKARKQVFQTAEGLAPSISTDLFSHSGGEFLDSTMSDGVQISLKYLE